MNENPSPLQVESIDYPRLFRAFYFEPLALERATMLSVHGYLWPRLTGQVPLESAVAAPGNNSIRERGYLAHTRKMMAEPVETLVPGAGWQVTDARYYWSVDGREDVAVIPLNGMILRSASYFQEFCMGAVSMERIAYALNQAMAAKEVRSIVLDIGSPGGQVPAGVEEVAALIRQATATRGKTVYAFSDSMIASAAYWIASQADEIITTSTARVGSIGTYLAWLDESLKMQREGVSLQLFKAGTFKGQGLPGYPMTEEDRAMLQKGVDDINNRFLAAVKMGRKRPSAEALRDAKVYFGADVNAADSAVAHGLVDGLASSFDEFLALI